MKVLFGIAAVAIALFAVIGLHEAGHAFTAHWFGVRVKRISIGFGPAILRCKTKSNLEFFWSLFPIGGYAHLLNSRIDIVEPQQFNHCFDKKPVSQRVLILLSGCVVNLLVAWLALFFMTMIHSTRYIPVIQSVAVASVAEKAKLHVDDRFVDVAGFSTPSWSAFAMRVVMSLGSKRVPITVCDPSQHCRRTVLDLSHCFVKSERPTWLNILGIQANTSNRYLQTVPGLNPKDAFFAASSQWVELVTFILVMLKQVITHTIPFTALLGPIGLCQAIIHSFWVGIPVFLYLVAHLSMAVAVVNLLPIPMLDGGNIVYALIEKIRGVPIAISVEILIYRLFFIALCILLVQLLMADIRQF